MKKIAEVEPHLFENHLVLALSSDWINYFGKIPKFVVILDDYGRLIFESEPATKKPKTRRLNND